MALSGLLAGCAEVVIITRADCSYVIHVDREADTALGQAGKSKVFAKEDCPRGPNGDVLKNLLGKAH
jgi:hypothetical protein